ncbi:hypothetical protein [Erythrobacter sp. AP23]|uniref:hypothetical protein n=1 Tax=Erythrobacter sp. AP23 TaxID=499656 RepID=UPI00076D6EEC|nr:hypothetical protein [Erythrobacter sp. AP23]KWV94598.1 hypothetical protein ASS64_08380 [Erythrobacter sp. AP23]
MFDTVGVLKRSFEPVDGGYLYYPTRWSHGYLVTPAEYEALIEDWRRVAGWKGLVKLAGLTVLAFLAGSMLANFVDVSRSTSSVVGYGVTAGVIGYLVWQSTAANRLVKGRKPYAPPRSGKEAEAAMGKTLGRTIAVWMVIVSLSFLAWAVFIAISQPLLGIPLAALIGVVAFLNFRIAVRAFRTKR